MAKKELSVPCRTVKTSIPSDEIVKKSNAIARARWQPESVWEPRIVALVASKVRTDDEDFLTYRIPVAELTGVSDENLRGNQYQEIRKSILHLAKATILIQGEKNPRNFMMYPIFSACGYEDGHLIARFDPDLKPHFLNLQRQFTEYSLSQFLLLPSCYSQRIFEFLKSWENTQEVIVLVEELQELLSTPKFMKDNFKNFRIRVLEKAHKDINEKTSLRYDWEPVKTGRKVTAIRFVFKKGRPHKLTPACQKIEQPAQPAPANTTLIDAVMRCWDEHKGKCSGDLQPEEVCALCRKVHRHTSKQQASLLD